MDYEKFYGILFKPLEDKYGPLDKETIMSIVGFEAGGPVSLSQKASIILYVTCELAAYPEQKPSSEGLRYELFSVGDSSDDWCRKVFSALGNLSFNAELGDQHTVDISGVIEGPDAVDTVKLNLFCTADYEGKKYGLYEVVAKKPLIKRIKGLFSKL